MKAKLLGVFVVKNIGDEYIEMDAYETGDVDTYERRTDQGTIELDQEGNSKEFDGYQIGNFFRFMGEYDVIRTNELFSKLMIDGQLLSFPNHKLEVVES